MKYLQSKYQRERKTFKCFLDPLQTGGLHFVSRVMNSYLTNIANFRWRIINALKCEEFRPLDNEFNSLNKSASESAVLMKKSNENVAN